MSPRKEGLPASAGDENVGSVPGSGRFLGIVSHNPLQYSSGKFHVWKSLAGYTPWGRKELDTTEHILLQTIKLSIVTLQCCVNWPFLINKITCIFGLFLAFYYHIK